MLSNEEIEKRFGHHKASIEGHPSQSADHAEVRRMFKDFARSLSLIVPYDSEYSTIAFRELEGASMWFHKAIANDYRQQ